MRQNGCVVHPISDHGHGTFLTAELMDNVHFVVRKKRCITVLNSELRGHTGA